MSKQIVEGKIDKIFVKDFGEADQYGNQYAVNININGQWYGLGKKKKPAANIKLGSGWHQLAEGDYIEAVSNSVERGDRVYHNIRASDITLKEAGNGGNSSVQPAGGGSSSGAVRSGGYSVGGDDRQDAIMRQSAMGYAANIVAATMTSKSSLDQAAEDVLRIANEWFLPYAKTGKTDDYEAEENELKNQQAAQTSSEEDFDDDLPF